MLYIWEWYWETCTTERLTYTELRSWSELTGRRLRRWEVDLMMSLDRIVQKVRHE